jgi:ribosome-associated translation inhibitor RaiA
MAEIIPFRPKPVVAEEDEEIDLYTAVDAAIRDLRDITARWGEEAARLQAEECRQMLERAFDAAY